MSKRKNVATMDIPGGSAVKNPPANAGDPGLISDSSVPGFSRQEYWSGLPFPSPEDLPNPGVEPRSLMSPVLAGGFFTTSATWEVQTGSKL